MSPLIGTVTGRFWIRSGVTFLNPVSTAPGANVTFTSGARGWFCGAPCLTSRKTSRPRHPSSNRSFSRAAGSSLSPRGTATSMASSTFRATSVAFSFAASFASFASSFEHATKAVSARAMMNFRMFMRLIQSKAAAGTLLPVS
jgi:hypothetical protein